MAQLNLQFPRLPLYSLLPSLLTTALLLLRRLLAATAVTTLAVTMEVMMAMEAGRSSCLPLRWLQLALMQSAVCASLRRLLLPLSTLCCSAATWPPSTSEPPIEDDPRACEALRAMLWQRAWALAELLRRPPRLAHRRALGLCLSG